MPISAQDFRRVNGDYDSRVKENVTDKSIQKQLNRIASSQSGKVPQQFGFLTILALLGFISDTYVLRNDRQLDFHADTNGSCVKRNMKAVTVTDNVTDFRRVNNIYLGVVSSDDSSLLKDLHHHRMQDYSCTMSLVQTRECFDNFIRMSVEKISHALRYYDPLVFPGADAAVAIKTTTVMPLDYVKTEKTVNDNYECIIAITNFTFLDFFNKVLDTLSLPITELIVEAQVLFFVKRYGVCPTPTDIVKVKKFSMTIDECVNFLMVIFPELSPIYLTREIIVPTIKLILDDLDNKEVSIYNFEKINDSILSYARGIASISTSKSVHSSGRKNKIIPKFILLKDGDFYINVNNKLWRLSMKNNNLYATRDNATYRISYDEDTEVWSMHEKLEEKKDVNDDPFYNMCKSRVRRGNNLGTMCSRLNISGDLSYDESGSSGRVDDMDSTYVHQFTSSEDAIINRLDIGITTMADCVDKLTFSSDWVIYRIRSENKLTSSFYHAVEMNGKLVPIKATFVHGNKISCRIYDINDKASSYRVDFYKRKWIFEPSTSIYVSSELKSAVTYFLSSYDFINSDELTQLSVSNSHGLQVDNGGHLYLRIDNQHIKVNEQGGVFYMTFKKNGRLYFTFSENQIELTRVEREVGGIKLNPQEVKEELALHSSNGWTNRKIISLNDHWQFIHFNALSQNYKTAKFTGSKIDFLIRMEYLPIKFGDFVEPPDIQWKEVIKCNDNNHIWRFQTNMYEHNKHSLTFTPWNNKYVHAYDYIFASRGGDQEPVRLLDRTMRNINPDTIPILKTEEEKINFVKDYLKGNGGILEVIISDFPKILTTEPTINKKRLLTIDFGFLDESLISVAQGINVKGEQREVFVTRGSVTDFINEPVNSTPPESITRKRIRK
ncbi:hypothetical protein [Symbiopectobacterium purcellii]|uniref:Uncharacterized protein n=1 Tax=Symbiopectobacterium purcellii TaxID=2871826 RepID=A0ABX9AQC0_9ENTR|nr:hypothetical protein [Symbiopectobacterium purcellii]QZN96556.1 hypothetical protein K6K13_03670 [Symbiopectobacterium purcellii]